MTDTIATTATDNNNKEICNDSSTIRSKKRLQKSTSLQPTMKNNNNNDMELAAEIGQGLLSEVRKMQSLLHQKEDTLMTLEHEKLEQEHQIDSLTKQLKQKTDREDQMNEEIWNLELAKQELMQQVQDLSRDLSKSLVEQNKLVQQERLSLTELDQLHSQQLLWNEKTEEYEQEIASLRRTITQLRREIKNLEQKHKQVTLLKESHAITKSNCSDMEEEEKNGDQNQLPVPQQQQQEQPFSSQVDTYTLQKSIESATSKNDQYVLDKLRLEISTLQDSLNHAHEIISVLEQDLKHERGDRQEIRQLLQEAQETIEILQEKHTEDDNDNNTEEQEEERQEERVTRPPQRETSLGDELVNAAIDNDSKEEQGEQEERIIRPPQREMSLGDELLNVANDNNEEEEQQEDGITQLPREITLDDEPINTTNDNEEEQQQEERITQISQREMSLDDEPINTTNDNEEEEQQQEERITQISQREMSLDDKLVDVVNDDDSKEKEQQQEEQEERITQLSQREMPLDDELVNAPSTSWEIISLEPITNHISPTSSPEITPSSSEQLQSSNFSKNYKSMIMRKRSNKNYGTCVVRSNGYADKNTPDDGGNKENSNDIKQKRGDQALISPARASAFDFDPTFVKNQQDDDNNDNSNLISSDSRATLTTNLVPAVTRTMIGDWMYKYTRKVVGSGISEKKHKRFFWIHPYTRTLYWGSQEPGVKHANGNKSALIISFQAVADNINPPSIMIQTPRRSLKVRCFDIMAHRAWVKALNYLVSDSEPSTITTKNNCAIEPSGSLSMLFQPRLRSSLCMPFSQPAASRSVASIHNYYCSSSNNNSPESRKRRHSFSRPFFEFSFSK
ncbi:meiotic cell cortex C-terminal pleckstrin homology-domain-containing protein [Circinella umbellata]|nr:meiotic cell cortex C-terminal pleckstrin homology-domain-containing protein [Circinella umbellata]